MKKLISFVALATLLSCTAQPRVLDIEYGAYSVDWIAVEESGWAGGYDYDTTILSLCEIRFDYGQMYTLVDGVIQPVPTMGFIYESKFDFMVELRGDILQIGLEEWVVVETPFGFELTRTTNYNGMGVHYHTMRLTEIVR